MNNKIFVWITVVALTFTLTNFGVTQMAYSTSLGDSIREEVKEKVDSNSREGDSNEDREVSDEDKRETDRDDDRGGDAATDSSGVGDNADNSRGVTSSNFESVNQGIEDIIRDGEGGDLVPYGEDDDSVDFTIGGDDRVGVNEGSGMQIFVDIRDFIENIDRDNGDGNSPIFRIPGVIKVWSPQSDRGLICNYDEIPCEP